MSEKIMLNFKLILIGDSNTGKTAILNQYIYHTFTNTKATTGIDYFTKLFEIDDFIVKLNIFDTAGQQRYVSMTKSYFKGTNAALFTYSLVEKQSFLNLPLWIRKFEQQAGHDALKVVVGTKSDLKNKASKIEKNNNFPSKFNKDEMPNQTEQTQKPKLNSQVQNKYFKQNLQNEVTEKQMQQLLQNNRVTFSFQTSALLNQNIDEVFQEICKFLILKEMNRKDSNQQNLNRSRVQSQFSKTKHSPNKEQKLSLQQKIQTDNNKKSSCC